MGRAVFRQLSSVRFWAKAYICAHLETWAATGQAERCGEISRVAAAYPTVLAHLEVLHTPFLRAEGRAEP